MHCDTFEKWTKEIFLSGKKVGSKVLTRSQAEQVKSYLSGAAPAKDAHFKFWVKSRGFHVTFDQDVSAAPSSIVYTSPSTIDCIVHNFDFFDYDFSVLLFFVRPHLAKFLVCCTLLIDGLPAYNNTVR